jgi:HK97 family phage portal protein
MGLFDGLSLVVQKKLREFVLGKALVDPSLSYWGVDPSTYTPEEYGNYIATSNSIYSIVTWRAQLMATLDLALFRFVKGKKREVETGRLYELLHRVNPHWTWNRLLQMTDMSLGIWGSCFWFLERGESGKGTPKEIWWGKPSQVTVFPDPVNYIRGYEYEVNGQKLWFEPDEVIWFRYPNPIDEFSGLSPIAAARLSVDYANGALKSNMNLFKNGNQMGGVMWPKARILTKEQAEEIENQVDKRTRGVDRAHRWNFFRFEIEAKEFGVTPKDAEFLGGLRFTLEEVCRAYHWPQDLVGGQRTYENFNAAMRAAYTHSVIPSSRFITDELKEKLLPMFLGEADEIELDSSDIEVLQELETDSWMREKDQIMLGALTINEWREKKGLDPYPWGNTWWASYTSVPVEELLKGPETGDGGPDKDADSSQLTADSEEKEKDAETQRNKKAQRNTRVIEYGSREHEAMWNVFVRSIEPLEKRFGDVVEELMKSQRESVLAGLRNAEADNLNTGAGATRDWKNPFNVKEWIKKFRLKIRPIFGFVVEEMGRAALDELKIQSSFDIKQPEVVRFIEQQAQRFAVEVNQTTWNALKKALAEGIDAGEGIDKLKQRVEEIMGDRIRSSAETIARTEVVTASNGGKLLAYKQKGVVTRKGWLAALDERTRDSHVAAHRKYQEGIDLDDDFEVGAGSGPAPGQIGLAEEDINCRCTVFPIV